MCLMGFLKKIPGFRSGTKWKMAVAIIGYLAIFGAIGDAVGGNSDTAPATTPATIVEKTPEQIAKEKADTDLKVKQAEEAKVAAAAKAKADVEAKVAADKAAAVAAAPAPTPSTPPVVAPSPPPKQTNQSVTVYVTKTGAKYHKDGCRSLSKSKIPISLSDAKSGYGPCSVCNPPQ